MDIFAKPPQQVTVETRTKTQVFSVTAMLVISITAVAASIGSVAFSLLSIATTPPPACGEINGDCDSDGIVNQSDNCIDKSNASQSDTNSDGYGNRCDPDYDSDNIVGGTDNNILRSCFGKNASSTPMCGPAGNQYPTRDIDLTGDGIVGGPDSNIMRSYFGLAPGPSARVATFMPFGTTTVDVLEGSQTTLGQVKAVVYGEPIVVSDIGWRFVITSSNNATTSSIHSIEVLNANGQVIAGPKNLTPDGSTATSGTATTTDSFVIPVGESVYTVRGYLGTNFNPLDTIRLEFSPPAIAATGQVTGTLKRGAPTSITIRTNTVRSSSLSVTVSGTPPAQSVVPGTQDFTVSNIILDATNSGGDVRVINLPISVRHTGASFPNNLSGFEIWDGSTLIPYTSLSTTCELSACSTPGHDATTTFTLSSGTLTVFKGTIKTIRVVVDVGSQATSGTFQVGQTGGVYGVDNGGNPIYAIYPDNSGTVNAGQIMTLVSGGTLNISTLPSPAAAQVVGGSTVAIGNFEVQAKNQDFNLNAFRFAIEAPDGGIGTHPSFPTGTWYKQVQTLSLYDGATLLGAVAVNNTYATISPSVPVSLAMNQTKTLTVKATLHNVGPNQNGIAGGGFAAYLSNISAANPSSGNPPSTINGLGGHSATSTNFKSFHVYKSKPTITQINTTNVLTNGVNTIKKFQVTADSAGPIGLWKFTFAINTTGVSLATPGYYLYESDSATIGTLLAQGQGSTVEGRQPYGGDFHVKYTGRSNDSFVQVDSFFDVLNDDAAPRPGEHFIVNAGATKYFTLQGTVTGVDGTLGNEQISVSMVNDNTFDGLGLFNSPGGPTVSSRAQAGFVGNALPKDTKFIWSDLNLDQYASSTATNAEMWFSGFRVSGFDIATGPPDIISDN